VAFFVVWQETGCFECGIWHRAGEKANE